MHFHVPRQKIVVMKCLGTQHASIVLRQNLFVTSLMLCKICAASKRLGANVAIEEANSCVDKDMLSQVRTTYEGLRALHAKIWFFRLVFILDVNN